MNNIDILEELANNEHIRWSNWQKYVHSKCIKNDDGSLTIPKEYVEHWEYEINTNYTDLPEEIKESDRKEVRQILDKINYLNLIAENKELKEERDMYRSQVNSAFNNGYILKSKVEEKIKEEKEGIKRDLENIKKIKDEGWRKAIEHNINIRNRKIDCLQSLLGKE